MRIPHRMIGLLAIAALAAACTQEQPILPTPTSPSPSPSPSPTPTFSPTPEPSPSPEPEPAEMPTTFAADLGPAEIPPEELVPDGADVTGQWFGFTDDGVVILIAWVEPGSDPFRLPRGLAVWRRAPAKPHWRAALVDRRPASAGITDIQASTTDLTGDGSDDTLVVEGLGGSGACGRWFVIDLARFERTYSTKLCDGRIDPGPPGAPGLVITESVFRPGDAHCCPSAIRETTVAWNGTAWRVTQKKTTET